ncbi:MAG: hypothetical protein EOP62_20095 [Sphingomonadales bacterium]|nr:MAG: hypothetical protein EOP62_20095 [Sphingomonadales bacterium]
MHEGKYLPGLIVAFAALPAHAQQASPTPTPPPPTITTIPAIIPERFSIGPPNQTPTPVPVPTPTPTAAPAATPTPRVTAPVQRPPAPQATQAIAAPTPSPTVIATPVPDMVPPKPQVIASPLPAPVPTEQSSPLLWALLGAGATASAGFAGWLLLRRRRAIEEVPAPVVVAPAAPPSPPPQLPPTRGVTPARVTPPVSAEPFEIIFQPLRIEIGTQEIVIDLELLIANTSGTGADGVRVSAAAISASPRQDAVLAAFQGQSQFAEMAGPFDLPAGEGGRLPLQLRLARDTLHVVDLGGRPMFVPIVAIDLRWRAGLSIRRHAASFMLGGAGPSGKPAPIWLDRGQPRGPFVASRYTPSA